MNIKRLFTFKERGFTLIELLIVIAVLGVLATVILIAINPLEQLARSRDSGRISAIGQLGNAMQAYYTAHNGVYINPTALPAGATNWIDALVDAGELKTIPPTITYSAGIPACAQNNPVNNYCAYLSGSEIVIYTRLESKANNSKCNITTQIAYFAWSSSQGQAGVICVPTGQQPTGSTFTFVP